MVVATQESAFVQAVLQGKHTAVTVPKVTPAELGGAPACAAKQG